MVVAVVRLPILQQQIEWRGHRRVAFPVTDGRGQERPCRLLARLNLKRLHAFNVTGNQILAQGEGESLNYREAHLEGRTLGQSANMIDRLVIARRASRR